MMIYAIVPLKTLGALVAVVRHSVTYIERELLDLIIRPNGKIRPYGFVIIQPSCQYSAFQFCNYSAFRIWPFVPVRTRPALASEKSSRCNGWSRKSTNIKHTHAV